MRINEILNSIQDKITTKAEDDMSFDEIENIAEESPKTEMMEYKKDFYDMSVGSLLAIATHANNILNALDQPNVKKI